jgi:hypothetical protein
MNYPLYRPKWKRLVKNKEKANSDWSKTDEEPEPAEPLQAESDPSDYNKNGMGWGPNAEPDETPIDDLTPDEPLGDINEPAEEIEEDPEPAAPLATEDSEHDTRDRSNDPGQFDDI